MFVFVEVNSALYNKCITKPLDGPSFATNKH